MARIPFYATDIAIGGHATIEGTVMNVREQRSGVMLVDVDVFSGPTRVLVMGLRETFRPSEDQRSATEAMLGRSWTFTVVRPTADDVETGGIHDGLMVVEDVVERRSMLLAA